MINHRDENLYSTAEAAKRLSISRQALGKLVRRGRVRPIGWLSGRPVFAESALAAWLKSKIKPKPTD